jgi:O-antigen ligase
MKLLNLKARVFSLTFFLYISGCLFSQSLIALSTALFIPWFFTSFQKISWTDWKKPSPEKLWLVTVAWVLYLYVNLISKAENLSHSYSALTKIPLWLLPVLFLQKNLFQEKNKKLIFTLITWGLTLTCALSIYQVFSLHLPATGFFKNPIYFSYSVFPLWLILCEYSMRLAKGSEDSIKQILKTPGFWGGLVSIILAETRMIWIVTAAYGIFLLFKNTQKKLKLITIAIVASASTFGIVYYSVPRISEKINRSFSDNDPSRSARFLLWQLNFKTFLSHPLTGVGTEQNGIDSTNNQEHQKYWSPGHSIYAHNLFLQILVEGGLISLLFFVYWCWCLIKLGTPTTRVLLTFTGVSGLTENISNNSRAFNPLLCAIGLSFLIHGLSGLLKDRRSHENPHSNSEVSG